METLTNSIKPQWLLWGAAIALAAFETAWLYAALPGINWAISTLAASLGLLICWSSVGKPCRFDVVLPLVLACLISAGAALTADPRHELLIAASVLFALGSAVVAAYLHVNPTVGPITWVVAAPYAVVLTACEARARFAETSLAVREDRGIPVIRGIALAIPVTLLLALLLSEADPTFAASRDFIAKALQVLPILPRGIFFAVLSTCFAGAFGIALHATPRKSRAPGSEPMPRQVFSDTETLIVLASVATLFALFLTLQVSYLFGNPGARAGSGISYADAVHRGFVELNAASAICGVLLFALHRYALSDQRNQWIKILQWIVTAEAQILLLSAFYRVNLYEDAYGYTRLRLYVQIYAAVASVALLLLLIELRAYPRLDRFLRRVIVLVGLVLAGVVWGNADAWIARANLTRYARTGRMDVPYLTRGLGPDAVPELVRALPHLPRTVAAVIEDCLRDRKQYRDLRDNNDRWFEWNLRRTALRASLADIGGSRPADGAPPGADATSCRQVF